MEPADLLIVYGGVFIGFLLGLLTYDYIWMKRKLKMVKRELLGD